MSSRKKPQGSWQDGKLTGQSSPSTLLEWAALFLSTDLQLAALVLTRADMKVVNYVSEPARTGVETAQEFAHDDGRDLGLKFRVSSSTFVLHEEIEW